MDSAFASIWCQIGGPRRRLPRLARRAEFHGEPTGQLRRRAATEPHPKLVELSEILVGTWRVTGPDITGLAQYRTAREGHLLVANVDFSITGSKMKIIQHISFTWVLDHPELRVSLEHADSGTYFKATLNEANSEYVGTWHYPEGEPPDPRDVIVYTRVKDAG